MFVHDLKSSEKEVLILIHSLQFYRSNMTVKTSYLETINIHKIFLYSSSLPESGHLNTLILIHPTAMFLIRTFEVVGQPRGWTDQGWAPGMVQNKKKGYLSGHTTANISGNFSSTYTVYPTWMGNLKRPLVLCFKTCF